MVHAYVALSFVALPITLAVAYVAWKRRDRPSIFLFFCLMALCSLWASAGSFSMLDTSGTSVRPLLLQVRLSAVTLVPVFLLAFSLDYTGRRTWLQPKRFAWLFVVPVLTQVLNWTPLRHLLLDDHLFTQVGRFAVSQSPVLGPWFPVHQIYSYSLVGIGLALLCFQIVRSRDLYRHQAAILFGGLLVAFATSVGVNVALAMQDTPSRLWLDWTVPTFTVIGLSWSWALFRVGFFEVMPVALDAVFECMNDAVIVLDTDDRVVDLNPSGSRLIGRSRTEAIGAKLPDVSSDLSIVIERAGRDEHSAEVSIDGRVFELRVSALHGARGRSVGRLAVLRDITERARLMRDLDAYARTVAHDLKNPVAVVTGYADLILTSGAALDPDTQECLTSILRTGEKMTDIINELLLLARVRSGDDVQTEPLEMGRIVRNAVNRMVNQIERTNARIVVAEEWPSARGYAAWVEEIWANYLSNALKYGGTPPQVTLGASSDSGVARFWVRDNGPGLNAEACARLFREFERLGSKRAEGHGLGLSIVLRIAEKLGGEVGVDSRPGEGCTFWFTLPSA